MGKGENVVLLVDVGNTFVHLGLCAGGRFLTFSQALIEGGLEEAGDIALEKLFRARPEAQVKVLVSSVNREAFNVMDGLFSKRGWPAPLVISPLVIKDYAQRNGMDFPNYPFLGSDLFCDLIAAKRRGCALFVADGGTCLKILGMDASGKFLGGSIAPGNALMLSSINRGTDLLKVSEVFIPKTTLMLSSDGAVSSGLTYGMAGMVEAVVKQAKEEFRLEEADLVLTGGGAPTLARALSLLGEREWKADPLLTLKGIALAFRADVSFE